MDNGGEVDRNAIQDAFSKIKEDMTKISQEIYDLKVQQKELLEENLQLKKQLQTSNNPPGQEIIAKVVKETLKNMQPNNGINNHLIKKFNKKRKALITNRILSLSAQKNISLPEIKEKIVDDEHLCSKATFYRYVGKLKNKGMIDFVEIDDLTVLVKI